MGDGAARWILEALEAYVLGDDAGDELRAAFRAGVRAGRELSTLSTPLTRAVGFRVSPLQPPSTTSPSGLDLLQDPLVDPKSTARANVEGGTLELFPRTVPLERRRKPRCRVPEDFALTPALEAFAEAGGLDARQELAAMKDHFRASGEVKADWSATFREWCRRAYQFNARAQRRERRS